MLTVTSGVSRGWNSLSAISEEVVRTGGVATVESFGLDAESKDLDLDVLLFEMSDAGYRWER